MEFYRMHPDLIEAIARHVVENCYRVDAFVVEIDWSVYVIRDSKLDVIYTMTSGEADELTKINSTMHGQFSTKLLDLLKHAYTRKDRERLPTPAKVIGG